MCVGRTFFFQLDAKEQMFDAWIMRCLEAFFEPYEWSYLHDPCDESLMQWMTEPQLLFCFAHNPNYTFTKEVIASMTKKSYLVALEIVYVKYKKRIPFANDCIIETLTTMKWWFSKFQTLPKKFSAAAIEVECLPYLLGCYPFENLQKIINSSWEDYNLTRQNAVWFIRHGFLRRNTTTTFAMLANCKGVTKEDLALLNDIQFDVNLIMSCHRVFLSQDIAIEWLFDNHPDISVLLSDVRSMIHRYEYVPFGFVTRLSKYGTLTWDQRFIIDRSLPELKWVEDYFGTLFLKTELSDCARLMYFDVQSIEAYEWFAEFDKHLASVFYTPIQSPKFTDRKHFEYHVHIDSIVNSDSTPSLSHLLPHMKYEQYGLEQLQWIIEIVEERQRMFDSRFCEIDPSIMCAMNHNYFKRFVHLVPIIQRELMLTMNWKLDSLKQDLLK